MACLVSTASVREAWESASRRLKRNKQQKATYMVVQRESRRKKKSDRAELTQVTDYIVDVSGRWSMPPQTRPKSFLQSTTFSLSDSRSKKSRQKIAAVTGLSNHADFLSGRIRPTGNGRVAAAYPRIQVALTVPGRMAGLIASRVTVPFRFILFQSAAKKTLCATTFPENNQLT